MNRAFALALGVLALTASGATLAQNAPAQNRNLEIYWVDVEGGQATLFISPTGESLLYDTGYPGNGDRDAKRIFAATQKAGLRQLDHVVISHWHGDHVGGLEALSKMIPISKLYDHGDGVEQADRARLDMYKTIAGNKRTISKAGDTIPFGGASVPRARLRRPCDRHADQRRRTQSALHQRGAPGARGAGEHPHGRARAQLRRFQVREPGRCRLVARDGARLPGQQARHDQRLYDQPPRRARQFRRAGAS